MSHAENAIKILEQSVDNLRVKFESQALNIAESDKTDFLEKTSLLSIAYYNKGCECEHLKNLIKATQAYSRAVNL